MELIKILEVFFCMTSISFCILRLSTILFNCFVCLTYYFLGSPNIFLENVHVLVIFGSFYKVLFGSRKVLGKKKLKENDFILFSFTLEHKKENQITR